MQHPFPGVNRDMSRELKYRLVRKNAGCFALQTFGSQTVQPGLSQSGGASSSEEPIVLTVAPSSLLSYGTSRTTTILRPIEANRARSNYRQNGRCRISFNDSHPVRHRLRNRTSHRILLVTTQIDPGVPGHGERRKG